MREIVLDTETTGLDPKSGHRIVEIGCIELLNHIPSLNSYHQYINPEREMPEAAFAIHGLSDEFLSSKPIFKEIADEFLSFVGDSNLIIHNASFDVSFINSELANLKKDLLDPSKVIDTISLARIKFPGASASLDALCRRFNIDNSKRKYHGALLDANLLSEVYIELIGGRQQNLALSRESKLKELDPTIQKVIRRSRSYKPSFLEEEIHRKFIETLDDPLWLLLENQDKLQK